MNRALSLTVLALLCAVPPLIPFHTFPLPTFYEEWFAAAFGLALAGFMIARSLRVEFAIPETVLPLGGMLIVLMIQLSGEHSSYRQPIEWALLYVLFSIVLVWSGMRLRESFGLDRVVATMAYALVATAVANGLCTIAQVYGLPELLQPITLPLVGDKRPYGNLGQSNLYADLTALGLGSLVYLVMTDRLRKALAVVLVLVMLVGLALAGSKLTLAYLIAIATWQSLGTRGTDAAIRRRGERWAWSLVLGYVGVDALMDLSGLSYAGGSLTRLGAMLSDGLQPGNGLAVRLHTWRVAWEIFIAQPLVGHGFGSFAWEYFQRSPDFSADRVQAFMGHPHNLLLHLLTDGGVLSAAFGVVLIGIWIVRIVRQNASPQRAWIGALGSIILLHAMLEFPLWYANFLALLALLFGLTSTRSYSIPIPRVGLVSFAGIVLGGFVFIGVLDRDYSDLRRWLAQAPPREQVDLTEAYERDRATLARLRKGILQPELERLLSLRMRIDTEDLDRKIALNEMLLRHMPHPDVVVRQMMLLALANRPTEAIALLDRALFCFPVLAPAIEATLAELSRDNASVFGVLYEALQAHTAIVHDADPRARVM